MLLRQSIEPEVGYPLSFHIQSLNRMSMKRSGLSTPPEEKRGKDEKESRSRNRAPRKGGRGTEIHSTRRRGDKNSFEG